MVGRVQAVFANENMQMAEELSAQQTHQVTHGLKALSRVLSHLFFRHLRAFHPIEQLELE